MPIYDVTIRTVVYSDEPLEQDEVVELATAGQQRLDVTVVERAP